MSKDTNNWPLSEEKAFWREYCTPGRHKSWYWWFLNIACGYSFFMAEKHNPKWLTQEVHRSACAWLQSKADRYLANRARNKQEQIKIGVEWPRRFGKTQCMIGMALAMQVADRDCGWGLGSSTIDKASEHILDPLRSILDGTSRYSWFTWLYGTWLTPVAETEGRRTNRKYHVVHNYRQDLSKKDKSYFCWGVRKGMTGKHPNGGNADDFVDEEALNEEEAWFDLANRHMDALKFAFEACSIFFHSYTRYRDEDPAGYAYKNSGVKEWAGMACPDERIKVKPEGQWEVYHLEGRKEDGTSLCPEIYTDEKLDEMEAENPITFSAQVMNNPGVGEHQLITMAQVRELIIPREELPEHGYIYIQCDTAFKPEVARIGTGDESVALVHLHDPRNNGVVYLLEGFGNNRYRIEEFSSDIVKLIIRLGNDQATKRYKIMGITDEITGGGKRGSWFAYLKQFAAGAGVFVPPLIELARGGKSKDMRVARGIGYWCDGRYKIVRGGAGVHNVISQAIRYQTTKKKDWIDASSDAWDELVYRPAIIYRDTSDDGAPLMRGIGSSRKRREPPMIYDEDAGIFDTIYPDVIR